MSVEPVRSPAPNENPKPVPSTLMPEKSKPVTAALVNDATANAPTPRDALRALAMTSRVKEKTKGALTLIGKRVDVSKFEMEQVVKNKVDRVKAILGQLTTDVMDPSGKSTIGEVVLDRNGNLYVDETTTEKFRRHVLPDYAGTAAAVSALYTNEPVIDTLPPESFALQGSDENIAIGIDSKQVLVTYGGTETMIGIKTKLYTIPGQQFKEGKPIATPDQKILVVQDIPFRKGELTKRIYAVSTRSELANDFL